MEQENKTKKKMVIKRNKDGSKFINLKPTVNESKNSIAVVSFGRFNPITTGHAKLVDKVKKEAQKRKSSPFIFISHSEDSKKNPLSYESKLRYMQKAFGSVVKKSVSKNIIEVAKELNGAYKQLVVVVGSDRVEEFEKLLRTYNNREYTFDNIEVISAGERDPDAEDVTGMSASKLRSLATSGKFEEFKKGVPSKLQSVAKDIYQEIRSKMGIHEEFDIEELNEREALTIQQRRKRGQSMRRNRVRLAIARKRAMKRKATPEKLKVRARRKAREIIRQRFLHGRDYGELSSSEKIQIDKRVLKVPDSVLKRIMTRQLPKVRQAEILRLSKMHADSVETKKESLDSEFENFINEMRECPPKRYHTAMTKEGKVKFDRRFKFFRKNPELNEDFDEDVFSLMEQVENITEKKSSDDPCWKDYMQVGMKNKNGKKVPNCVPTESVDENDPSNREQGTNSLVRILKKNTPGQRRNESYFSSEIPEVDFSQFKRGARVRFSSHSMDMVDGENEKEGTIVGSNVSHLRVRDDSGMLYKVRHADAVVVENYIQFTLDEAFEFRTINENTIEKAVDVIRKHVLTGKELPTVIWDFSAATGFKFPTKDLYNRYIEKFNKDTNKSLSSLNSKYRDSMIQRYT
jgi:nicotinic acid mononucleotide adenylyltransferase